MNATFKGRPVVVVESYTNAVVIRTESGAQFTIMLDSPEAADLSLEPELPVRP